LRTLGLSYNRLTILPSGLGSLARLESLDAQCNRLRELPAGIGKLRALRELRLQENQLRALPDEVAILRQLSKLMVTRNELRLLPEAVLRRRRQFQQLGIAHNPLLLRQIALRAGGLSNLDISSRANGGHWCGTRHVG